MNRADPQRLADYLQHILEAIDNIRDYTAGATLDTYRADRKTQDAVLRNLEVIGEASNNVGQAPRRVCRLARRSALALRLRMRNALSHGYFTVDQTLVWQTVQNDLPPLRAQIAAGLTLQCAGRYVFDSCSRPLGGLCRLISFMN